MGSELTFGLGVIGTDTSHLPEFTKRINALSDAGETRCRVTRLWTDGQHGMRAEQAHKWQASAVEMGVRPASSIEELLDDVNGVMVLSVNGHTHLRFATPALVRGLPTYIDKPLTCSLAEAKQLLSLARQHDARCYSASSLRFAAEVTELPRQQLGAIHAIDAFGPGELNPSMEGLFFYGVHLVEMVDAIWGPGVARASSITMPDRDLLDLEYHDGRYARLRMERRGCYDFGATVHGEKKVHQFRVDFADVYNRLIRGMTRFFEGAEAPTTLRDLVENVAVMEAGNRSMKADGVWIEVPLID
jgi:predicted dehydrogenase